MVKDGWKSFRTTEKERSLLKKLKKAHVGKTDADRLRMGIECLAEKYDIAVPA